MHSKYRAALSAQQLPSVPRAAATWERLCRRNAYATSLELINGALLKLSRVQTPQPAFVALSGERAVHHASAPRAATMPRVSPAHVPARHCGAPERHRPP